MSDQSRVLLRLPSDLHEKLKTMAENDNRSLNNYLVNLLDEYVTDKYKPVSKGQLNLLEEMESPEYAEEEDLTYYLMKFIDGKRILIRTEDEAKFQEALKNQDDVMKFSIENRSTY
ncbi:toxin-antitoxin system HicB family antitoxin [Lederbergia lenta]|uniref:toxin-antitoxin system HicB family antitoxin n=1 Tax=Lederbergia lenta TaxID=1467 RepID=UPI00203DE8DE|nr:toxin-antitoxin system HicB family antitoxin [Lederbergia lenta]MCM3110044.1 toxin-antitoxin system HicB family antitoxin [Lederbergia lenta]